MVTDVKSEHSAQKAGSNETSSEGQKASFACQAPVIVETAILTCILNEPPSDTDNVTSTVNTPLGPDDSEAECNLKCVRLEWNAKVLSVDFGSGPTIVDENTICVRVSDGVSFGDCKGCCDSDEDSGTDGGKGDAADDLSHQLNEPGASKENSRVGKKPNVDVKDASIIDDSGEGGENIDDSVGDSAVDGKQSNKDSISREDDIFKSNGRAFFICFMLSVLVIMVLLAVCIYLWLGKSHQLDRKLSTISKNDISNPIVSSFKDHRKEIEKDKARNASLNKSFCVTEVEDSNIIQLRERNDGDYMTPRELPSSLTTSNVYTNPVEGDFHDIPIRDSVDSIVSEEGGQEDYEVFNAIASNQIQTSGDATANTTTTRTGNPQNHAEKPPEVRSTNDEDKRRSRRESLLDTFAKRKQMISALLKRPRLFSNPEEASAQPAYVTAGSPAPPRKMSSPEEDPPGSPRQKPIPRKPRRTTARQPSSPKPSSDDAERKPKAYTVSGNAPPIYDFTRLPNYGISNAMGSPEIDENNAFNSADSHENVMKFITDRTSSVYCNL